MKMSTGGLIALLAMLGGAIAWLVPKDKTYPAGTVNQGTQYAENWYNVNWDTGEATPIGNAPPPIVTIIQPAPISPAATETPGLSVITTPLPPPPAVVASITDTQTFGLETPVEIAAKAGYTPLRPQYKVSGGRMTL